MKEKTIKLTVPEIKILLKLMSAAEFEPSYIIGECLDDSNFSSVKEKLTTYFKDHTTVCWFKKIYGFSRPRRRGECPEDCIIDSYYGRRRWGDGCKQYVKINKGRERKIVPPTTGNKHKKL